MQTIRAFLAATVILLSISTVLSGSIHYDYDLAGRLTHAYYADGAIEYVYDPAGNLLERIVTASVSPSPIEPSMIASRVAGGVVIAYATDECLAADHAVFIGALGDFDSVTSADCSIGSSGTASLSLPAGSVWFLVAGVAGESFSSVGNGLSGLRVLSNVDAECAGFTPDTSQSCP